MFRGRQAYDDIVPYSDFSLSFPLSDVHRLPALLRAVPAQRLCALRKGAARYFRLFLWGEPGGLAYDMLQLSLCRRALRLHRDASPAWAACARMTAEELLDTNRQARHHSKPFAYKMSVPTAHVGVVIGPAGQTFRDIMKRSGAHVRMTRSDTEWQEIDFTGTAGEVQAATDMVKELLRPILNPV